MPGLPRYARKVRRDGSEWSMAQIGNGIFWKEAAFELVEAQTIPFARTLADLCEDDVSKGHFGRGAQVAVAAVLRQRTSGALLVALSTHLSANFQEPWTQIAQMHVAVSAAAKLAAKHGPRAAPRPHSPPQIR